MPGVRAYTLIDVLKHLNDQSDETVAMAQNEVQNILFGSQNVVESIIVQENAPWQLTLLSPMALWGPISMVDSATLTEQSKVTQSGSTAPADIEPATLAEQVLVTPAPPAGGPQVLVPNYAAKILTAKPIVWWRLGEQSGTTAADSSGGGHTGTYNGGCTLGQVGAIPSDTDTAVLFDGSSGYVSVAPISLTKFTLEIWVYSTQPVSVPGTFNGFNGNYTGAAASRPPGMYLNGGTSLQFGFGTGASWLNKTLANIFVPNTWTYLTWTFDGTNSILYKNGVAVDTDTTTWAGQTPSTGWAGVGRMDNYFAGRLDEVAVYNRALSPTEVLAHYTQNSHVGTWGLFQWG